MSNPETAFSKLFDAGQIIIFQPKLDSKPPTLVAYPFKNQNGHLPQFIVLNPSIRGAKTRDKANIACRQAFTVEQDAVTLEMQRQQFKELGTPTVANYSGGKSIHNHIRLDREITQDEESQIISLLKKVFPFADFEVITNPAGLVRTPGAIRKDEKNKIYDGKIQQIEIIGERWAVSQLIETLEKASANINSVVSKANLFICRLREKYSPEQVLIGIKEKNLPSLGEALQDLLQCGYSLDKESWEYKALALQKKISDVCDLDKEIAKAREAMEESKIVAELDKVKPQVTNSNINGKSWRIQTTEALSKKWKEFYEGYGITFKNEKKHGKGEWLRGFTAGKHGNATGGFWIREDNGYFYDWYRNREQGFPNDFLVKYQSMNEADAWKLLAEKAGVKSNSNCKFCDAAIEWDHKTPMNLDWTPHKTTCKKKVACKTCAVEIYWQNRKAFNLDGSEHKHTRAAARAELSQDAAYMQENTQPDTRPVIRIEGGKLPKMVDQIEEILVKSGIGIYQRAGLLVRLFKSIDDKKNPRINIGLVGNNYLVEVFTKIARWEKYDSRKHIWVSVDCPKIVSETYLARGEWEVPVLTGIIECPTLREDGSILDNPGYDFRTGLYFHSTIEFPEIPQNPTEKQVQESLSFLKQIYEEFPFVKNVDLSVLISAISTALVRKSLRTAPMFGLTAPVMASGKSLLAETVGLIATGHLPKLISPPSTPEEEKKELVTLLLASYPVIVIDNIEKPFGSAIMNSVLSQEEWSGRLLGVNKDVGLSTRSTFLATGNNLTFQGDITTRVLLSCLDPNCDRPAEIEHKLNLYEFIPKNRGKIVQAVLTILRAYFVAEQPKQAIAKSRYPEWDKFVRSALVWAGLSDPCQNISKIEDHDPIRERLAVLVETWYSVFQSDIKTVKEVVATAKEMAKAGDESLYESLLEVAGERGEINAVRLGRFLKSYAGRIEGGMKIVEGKKDRERRSLWQVVSTEITSRIGQASMTTQSQALQIAASSQSTMPTQTQVMEVAASSKLSMTIHSQTLQASVASQPASILALTPMSETAAEIERSEKELAFYKNEISDNKELAHDAEVVALIRKSEDQLERAKARANGTATVKLETPVADNVGKAVEAEPQPKEGVQQTEIAQQTEVKPQPEVAQQPATSITQQLKESRPETEGERAVRLFKEARKRENAEEYKKKLAEHQKQIQTHKERVQEAQERAAKYAQRPTVTLPGAVLPLPSSTIVTPTMLRESSSRDPGDDDEDENWSYHKKLSLS